ncbi:MAG: BatD family protein [Anaerolineae bacterium]
MKATRFAFVTGLLLILLRLGPTTLAQSPVAVEVDRTSLPRNEQLTLTLTVDGTAFVASPDLSGLEDFFVVGSSTSTQISIINGQTTAQVVFVYRLQSLKEGDLVIGPIRIDVGGQVYETEPIEIEVLPPSAPPPGQIPRPTGSPNAPQNLDFFVEAEVDNPRPYLGQQITYTFRTYQAVRFRYRPDYRPPSFTDFWSKDLPSAPEYVTTVDGREYLVTETRTALFPANLGSIRIEPATLAVPGGFFEADVVLETEPVTVEVQSLPEGAPPDFGGAVGQFDINAQLSQPTGTVNETLSLAVEITGSGNIDALTEPALPELRNWRFFNSQATTSIDFEGDRVGGTRRFEWLIVPGQPGDYIFPSLSFSYFDPLDETYHTVSTEPIPITVEPGEQTPFSRAVVGGDGQTAGIIAGNIRHIKPAPFAFERGGNLLLAHPLYWGGWALPALAVGGLWAWQNRRQRLLGESAYARSRRARRKALQILAGGSQSRAGEDALAQRALVSYLSDKLNQPVAGLTAEQLVDRLQQAELSPALIERVQALLQQIDIGRFAPTTVGQAGPPSPAAEAQDLINDLEAAFGEALFE